MMLALLCPGLKDVVSYPPSQLVNRPVINKQP
jgi:hypothetical protein